MKKIITAGLLTMMVIVLSGCNVKDMLSKKTDIGQEAAKAKTEDFLKNGLGMPEGTQINIKEIIKENGLYKMVMDYKANEQQEEQEIITYITLDGKKFLPPGSLMDIDSMTELMKNTKDKTAGDGTKNEQKEIPKSDKPEVNLYVMSFCPYGNKAEDTLKPVYDLLKNKVTFNFHYIVSIKDDKVQSLHGEKEVAQNKREACVLKNYGKDKWMGFVTYVNANCGTDGACWEAGAKSLAISTEKINACANSDGVNLMKADQKASDEANASGSPTMTINGVSTQVAYQYGNSEAYKKAICDAFNTAPAECEKVLESKAAAVDGGSCAPAQ